MRASRSVTSNQSPDRSSLSGAILIALGVALAVIFAVLISWPDREAANFDRTLVDQSPLRSLRCPLVITPQDDPAVSVTLKNTHVRDTSLRVRARIAEGNISVYREEIRQVALEPDEEETLRWPIDMEDAVYDRIVMARVNQFRRTPFPARSSTCGVLVLGVPVLTGTQVVILLAMATLLTLAAGVLLWVRAGWPLTDKRRGEAQRTGLILGLVLASIIVGLLQFSVIALFLLILAAIVVGSLLEQMH